MWWHCDFNWFRFHSFVCLSLCSYSLQSEKSFGFHVKRNIRGKSTVNGWNGSTYWIRTMFNGSVDICIYEYIRRQYTQQIKTSLKVLYNLLLLFAKFWWASRCSIHFTTIHCHMYCTTHTYFSLIHFHNNCNFSSMDIKYMLIH